MSTDRYHVVIVTINLSDLHGLMQSFKYYYFSVARWTQMEYEKWEIWIEYKYVSLLKIAGWFFLLNLELDYGIVVMWRRKPHILNSNDCDWCAKIEKNPQQIGNCQIIIFFISNIHSFCLLRPKITLNKFQLRECKRCKI